MTANAPNALDDAPLSRFHKKLALYSSGGPFLDGYVLSIIGVAMVQITPQMELSGSAQGLIGAGALIGIFLGAFAGGYLTDRFGRQVLYTIDLIAIIV
jgi:MFS transporter, putative metabolite transport protein